MEELIKLNQMNNRDYFAKHGIQIGNSWSPEYNGVLPMAQEGLETHDCPIGFTYNEKINDCVNADGKTVNELLAEHPTDYDKTVLPQIEYTPEVQAKRDNKSHQELLGVVGNTLYNAGDALGKGIGATLLGGYSAYKAAPYFNKYTIVNKRLDDIALDGRLKGLSDWEIAKLQMEKVGITSAQRKAYNPLVSNFVEKNVFPKNYGSSDLLEANNKLAEIFNNIKKGGWRKNIDASKFFQSQDSWNSRLDAWKLYLGIPQENNTFEMATTAPVNHPGYEPGSLKDTDIYSINPNREAVYLDIHPDRISISPRHGWSLDNLQRQTKLLTDNPAIFPSHSIMGGHNQRLDKFGLQYNDIWDVEPPMQLGSRIQSDFPKVYNFLSKDNPIANIIAPKLTSLFDVIPIPDGTRFLNPKETKFKLQDFIGKPFMTHGLLQDVTPESHVDIMLSKLIKDREITEDYKNDPSSEYFGEATDETSPVGQHITNLNNIRRDILDKNISEHPEIKNLIDQHSEIKNTITDKDNKFKLLWDDYTNGKITKEEYIAEQQNINTVEDLKKEAALSKQIRQKKIELQLQDTHENNILTSESQLGKNISTGGSNTIGVYELPNNQVARLSKYGYDDASLLVNYKDKITSPVIKKTLQVKNIDGKVYQVQQRATGNSIYDLTESQISKIPKEHLEEFWKAKRQLDNLGLNIDISGKKANIFYDPAKGFEIIDLGIGQPTSTKELINAFPFLEEGITQTPSFKNKKFKMYNSTFVSRVNAANTNTNITKEQTARNAFKKTPPPKKAQTLIPNQPSISKEQKLAQDIIDYQTKLRKVNKVESFKTEEGLNTLKSLLGKFIKYGSKVKEEYGGMITDPMGQWAHPGENTRIPGGNITMQGVPYPVLAKASNGQQQMMYPEQEYHFPGADHVDEYPMMNLFKNGGGLLSRTVSCSNCGWSWKAVDGGKDVMTCHKCGGMIKMKNGGDISIPQLPNTMNYFSKHGIQIGSKL